MNWLRGTKGTLLVAALAMLGTTCTLLLDRSTVQCKTDNDCASLGTHPFCRNSLCVPSGFQPDGCFLTNPPQSIPMAQTDFLNACGTNYLLSGTTCLSFPQSAFDDGGMGIKTPMTAVITPKASTAPTTMCKDMVPAGKQILYLTGSSNFAPLLGELSQVIVNSISIVPVFRTTTSCQGVRSMNTTTTTYNTDHYIKDPTTATDTYAQIYLGNSNTGTPCLLGSAGIGVDIGESEIAQDTCQAPVNPTDSVGESLGPILPIIFVVPKLSEQKVISAAAAYQIFGGGGGVAPWEDYHFLYIRANGTATLRLVAKQVGLQPTQFWGIDQGSAATMADDLAQLTTPDEANKALGMIGTDYYDQPDNRGRLKALAFQANNQSCAYLPDSNLTSRDKANVRDGHYPLWGRIHFFAARLNNAFTSAPAASFLMLFANPTLDPDILAALIRAGFVPPCAMTVTRTEELGDFTYTNPPAVACGCVFDSQVGVTPMRAECTTCMSNSDCPATRPSCNYGFCEQSSQ